MQSPSTDRNENQAHQALLQLIKQEADRHGVLSFARFMELALYTPDLGFYQRSKKVIGRSGDFFTSVSVGQLFGELLACQFASWIRKIPEKNPVIVEAGAHDGHLARDIMENLNTKQDPALGNVEYWIIEPSMTRREWQQTTLENCAEKIRWFRSWTELSSFRDSTGHPLTGVVFCNELLDAMPVHRLKWDKSLRKWMEDGVITEGEKLRHHPMPRSEEVLDYQQTVRQISTAENSPLLWPDIPAPLLDALPDGFVTEICPGALSWWKEAAQTLTSGWLMTLDYGLLADEFFMPQSVNGTVRGYRDHKHVDDVLADPGEQDITAHVNFTAVEKMGDLTGMKTQFLGDQSKFLTMIVADLWPHESAPFSPEQIREFQTLTHPSHLGRAFKVLVQSRNISAAH